jgi:uncharacterized protein (DUF885 family)
MAIGAFRDVERSYFDLRWHLDPVAATQAGLTLHDHRYGRFSPAALAPHLAALKSIALALEEAAVDSLQDEIDRTALLNAARVDLRRLEREKPQAKNPEFWLSHLLSGLHALLVRADRTPEQKALAVIARLEDVPAFLDDARATLREPVRVFAETGLQVVEGGVALLKGLEPALAAQAPDYGSRVAAAVQTAGAALTAFDHDLDRWLESGSEQFALGETEFDFRLHYEHALRDSAPELWRYGLRLKEELEEDLKTRAARLDGGRGWPEVAEKLRADHPAANALVDSYAREMARARDFVAAKALAPIPDAPLQVVPTPPFMRPTTPFAAYEPPGPYSSDRAGLFYVTVPDPKLPPAQRDRILRDHCGYEVAVTALHEGYPGHHRSRSKGGRCIAKT